MVCVYEYMRIFFPCVLDQLGQVMEQLGHVVEEEDLEEMIHFALHHRGGGKKKWKILSATYKAIFHPQKLLSLICRQQENFLFFQS